MEVSRERDIVQQKAYAAQFSFFTPVQVRFNDVDPLNHVNNAVYQEFYDLGRLQFLYAHFSPIPRWDEVAVVIASLDLDFYLALTGDSQPRVGSRLIGYDEKRVWMEQLLLTGSEEEPIVHARCETLLVGFDAQTGHSTELLPAWIPQIERLLPPTGRKRV